MLTENREVVRFFLAIVDALITIASFIVAVYLRNALLNLYTFGSYIYWQNYPIILLAIVLIWRGLFGYHEAYVKQRFTSLKTDILIVLKTIGLGTCIILTIAFMIKSDIPRSLIFSFSCVNFIFFCIGRVILYKCFSYHRSRGRNQKRVLILGTGDTAKEFLDSLKKYPDWGFKVVGLVCTNECEIGVEIVGYKIIGRLNNLREIMHKNPIDELVIASQNNWIFEGLEDALRRPTTDNRARRRVTNHWTNSIEDVIALCEEEGVSIRIVSSFLKNLIVRAKTDTIHNVPFVRLTAVERTDFERLLKRSFDIVISISLLILLLPLFVVIALIIKIDSRGPVFYQWKILGLNKHPLTSYKFRTMVENADMLKKELMTKNEMNGAAFKMKDDPRITRVGKWLRKLSLDELPQLWSVLKGDLSLVGPRPPLQTEIEAFDGWHRRKLSVKPGITCLWQVSGRNDINNFDEWMRLDMQYIDNWNLWLDLKILFLTAYTVIRGTGR